MTLAERSSSRLVLVAVILSGQALFNDERDGRTRFVRNHVHQVSQYLEAFAAAGLVGCETTPAPAYEKLAAAK